MIDGIPEEWQADAEAIRAHLVALRGGAPFLSPNDARLLLRWLEEGVAVPTVLAALERAADNRSRKPSRLPFGLHLARPHLGKRASLDHGLVADPDDHPLAAVAEVLRAAPTSEGPGPAALADALLALPTDDPEALLRGALELARAFFDERWHALDPDERARRLDDAGEELGDLLLMLDEVEQERAREERVRDQLRRAWPCLHAAALWDLVDP